MKNNTLYIFIFSIILFVVVGLFALFVQKSISNKIEIVNAYYVKENQNKNIEFGNKLKKESENLNRQESILKGALIDSQDVVNFIAGLETEGGNSGMNIVVEKVVRGGFQKLTGPYSIESVSFNVQTEGTFSQITTFIDKINKSNKLLTIKELKVYKIDMGGESERYTVRMVLDGIIIKYE